MIIISYYAVQKRHHHEFARGGGEGSRVARLEDQVSTSGCPFTAVGRISGNRPASFLQTGIRKVGAELMAAVLSFH